MYIPGFTWYNIITVKEETPSQLNIKRSEERKMYKNSKGKMIEARLLGGKGQEDLIAKGYHIILAKFRESEQELYDRLTTSGYNYKSVRIWKCSTAVRGIHDIFAMVK